MAEAKKEKEVLLCHVKSGENKQTIDLTQEQIEVEFRGFRSALEEHDRKGFEFSETRGDSFVIAWPDGRRIKVARDAGAGERGAAQGAHAQPVLPRHGRAGDRLAPTFWQEGAA